MKKIIAFILTALAVFTIFFYARHPLTAKVAIRGHVFTIEVAATEAEKEKGLGDRDSLPQNSGMIFPYDRLDKYKYWMKGMRFPIDIIWIQDYYIVDITKNVPVAVGNYFPQYAPSTKVNKVLELNAGTVDAIGAQIGDPIRIYQ